ncbi:ketoacyl-ACP synthase III family protein [Streptomyces sp. NPDC050617]|uniref:ketoacyl-ACP synthase III family protein n=1 Tax=Streptomyces sp. NPDC050617 TaxID=3154628 RepID=UPI00341ACE3A
MKTKDVFVGGLGVYVPEKMSMESAVAEGMIDAAAAKEYDFAGIAVAGETPAPEMALHAVREALQRSGKDQSELGMLLYASVWYQGPDGWCPQYYIQRHAVGGNVVAAEVRQGCMGMFSALELAAGYLMGVPERDSAVITSADNFNSPRIDRLRFSPHFPMADAGCAVVLTRTPGFARLESVNAVTLPEYEGMHRSGEPMFPPGETLGRPLNFAATKKHWMENAEQPPGGPLPIIAAQDELVTRTLEESGIEIDDVTKVAYVNGSRGRVEGRGMIPLGLPMSRSTWDFSRTIGHAGASDQFISLEHLVRTGELGPGDHFLMLGVGPGFNIACAVFSILERPSWVD